MDWRVVALAAVLEYLVAPLAFEAPWLFAQASIAAGISLGSAGVFTPVAHDICINPRGDPEMPARQSAPSSKLSRAA